MAKSDKTIDPRGVNLCSLLRSSRERAGMSQQDLANETQIVHTAISQFENGRRLPSIPQIAILSEVLEIDPTLSLFALFWEEVNRVADEEFVGETARIRTQLLSAIEHQLRHLQSSKAPSPRALGGMLTLRDWPSGFNIRNVLVGDRRESPPNNFADVLALPASTGDLSYYGDLGLAGARIRSDKIVKIADTARLRDKLDGDLLVIGSPAANLAARVVNKDAFHRFRVERKVQEEQVRIERELEKIAYDADALEAYVTPSNDENIEERIQALKKLLYEFAKPGFVCPTSYPNEVRGFVRNARVDFGVVTICRNPWSDTGIAILAAGIGGPGTAAALKVLATPKVFDDHPLGGVFEVRIATEAPWENRYDMLKPKWDSDPYTIPDFKAKTLMLGEDTSHDTLNVKEANSLINLIELLESRA